MPDTIDQAPIAPLTIYQCRHIFLDGHRCGSKCLRHEEFCYYHHATRPPAPHPNAVQAEIIPPAETTFAVPFPENRASIQLSIGEILRRIATNTIDLRRAGLLLYGLQIASLNLPRSKTIEEPESSGRRVQEIVHDPALGPLAPIAEFVRPKRPLTLAGRLLRDLGEEPVQEDDDEDD